MDLKLKLKFAPKVSCKRELCNYQILNHQKAMVLERAEVNLVKNAHFY